MKIFYSWQSDLPNKTNRTLIEEALSRAAESVRASTAFDIEPVIDRDTRGVPGSPDIASTILQKIEDSDAFVGDVSLVTGGGEGRSSPNPNVLIELGYALRALGPTQVVLVFNEAFGNISDLPFDLRGRRVVPYKLEARSAPKEQRAILAKKLEVAVRHLGENSKSRQLQDSKDA